MLRFAAALTVLLSSAPALAEPIVGRATVVDGDTIEIQGVRIRLYGIDAPESRQICQDGAGRDYRCGKVAAFALADRIGRSPISCDPREFDRYGRVVATCRLKGEDLNGWLVARGNAVAYRQYGRDYVGAEERAKAARAGVWAGRFEMPWEWRRERR